MFNGEFRCCDYCGVVPEQLKTKEIEDSNGDSLLIDLCLECYKKEYGNS